jgi:N-sulfoglucosamine sulfohydrolase
MRLCPSTLGILCIVLHLIAQHLNAESLDVTRPNILIAISDDQSFAHTSIAGYQAVSTPAFDRVAREGVWFRNAFAPAPGCSPTRAALLTGRHIWQIEQAGTHASSFPAKYVTYPDLLEQAGYVVGFTGKGWGPGNFKVDQRPRNPAGRDFSKQKCAAPLSGIGKNDYAANFAEFLTTCPDTSPFCFWYGANEPHRGFEKGSGLAQGKRLEDATPPPFLPDTPEVRSDILDYCAEIEWFDQHLGRMLKLLEERGCLENTLVIVTSDNGMAFPRAKANLYEYGFHMPLAIRWGAHAPGGRTVDDLVSFVDLTATILEASQVTHPSSEFPPSGRSLVSLLENEKQGIVEPERSAVFAGRERHSSSRYNNWTYPQRAIRTHEYLYIRNFRPSRWPAGDPAVLGGKPHSGYKDIDPCPTFDFLIANSDDESIRPFFELAVAKRPSEEMYDIINDPGCLQNLAEDERFASSRASLAKQLDEKLRSTGDARIIDGGEVWESYLRYSILREFPKPD